MATADETARMPERAAETASLVRAARAGDREAFGRLVELHQRAVTRLAYRILDERDDADGAAQDAFVKAWRSLGGFREECPFDAGLSRIGVNQCRDRLKRARRRVMETPLDLDVAAPSREVANQLDQAVDFAADPEARCAGREIARKIAEQVGTLPDMQRDVFALRYYEDRPLALPRATAQGGLGGSRRRGRPGGRGRTERAHARRPSGVPASASRGGARGPRPARTGPGRRSAAAPDRRHARRGSVLRRAGRRLRRRADEARNGVRARTRRRIGGDGSLGARGRAWARRGRDAPREVLEAGQDPPPAPPHR